MLYYLYNPSTDTDKAVNDIGLIVAASEYLVVDSNDINGFMLNSSDLYNAIATGAGDATGAAGDQGLTLHSALPTDNTTVYTTAQAHRRLSLSKDATLVEFDNSTALLPNSPQTVQAALQELDTRLDDLSGAAQWKEHVIARVLEISAVQPVGTSGDMWIDTTNSPDELYKYTTSWNKVRDVNDGDRVIDLSDTAGTYDDEIFVYDATGDSWSSAGTNVDNDAVIVDDDGDGSAAMYTYDTATGANGGWVKTADIDWGSPTLQSVYDAGSNSVTMASGAGSVDWNLYDGGTWEVSTGALYFRAAQSTTALNLSASVSSIDLDAAGTIAITATGAALTLQTATSGNVVIDSAADVTLDGTNFSFSPTGTITWDDGTNTWAPEQIGLRFANYATGGLPTPTGYFGSIAFDTTLDRPVIFVDDADGLGNDGWLQLLTTSDTSAVTFDDAYNNSTGTAATPSNHNVIMDAGDLSWYLTSSSTNTAQDFAIADRDGQVIFRAREEDDGAGTKTDLSFLMTSNYYGSTGSGDGIDISDVNNTAGGTGGGISLSTTAVAGTAGNISLNSAGNFTIAGDANSSVSVDSANLTLQTTGASGDVNVTSVGGMTVTLASNVSWTDGVNSWTPQQVGLRFANYSTAGLPATPGTTANYGAVAFDTTLDRLVVWSTDSDGSGTDGWLDVLTSQDNVNEDLDEAYNNFGNAAALVTIDAAESQTTGLEFALAANTDTFFVSDGTNAIATFTRDDTASAADGRLDIGDTAILGLPNYATAAAPSVNNAAGDTLYNSTNGFTYVYDGTRSKWLSVQRVALNFSSQSADGQYLHPGGTARANTTGYRMPFDGTITSVTVLSAGGNATKGMRIVLNNNYSSPLGSFNLVSSAFTDNALNLNFSAGDYIGIGAVPGGDAIYAVVALIEVAYRM